MAKPDEREHFQTLFEYAPISLWEEDYSGIKRLFDALREQGVESLEAHLDQTPDFIDECMRQMAAGIISLDIKLRSYVGIVTGLARKMEELTEREGAKGM